MVTRNVRRFRRVTVEFDSTRWGLPLLAEVEIEPDGVATVQRAWLEVTLSEDDDRRARELATEE